MTILTATAWPTNAELIEDVARLGYLSGQILDCTYGYGTFWKNWRPAEDRFVACDIDEAKSPLGVSINFCKLPFNSERFDSVVFDPPYKMNGTSRPEDRAADERYGVHIPARWQDRMQLICDGLIECMRVSRRYVLAKCMDQVVSGRKVWQMFELPDPASLINATIVIQDIGDGRAAFARSDGANWFFTPMEARPLPKPPAKVNAKARPLTRSQI